MPLITYLAWQRTDGRWWPSSVVFPALTEQGRNIVALRGTSMIARTQVRRVRRRVRPQDLPDFLKQYKEEQLRHLPRIQADKIQTVYDRVLHSGRGRDVEDVKILLAREWRSVLGSDLGEPTLSQAAVELASGKRIKINLREVH